MHCESYRADRLKERIIMLQQRIQTFLEVANCLSFSTAAKNLYVSQQAVTRQIAALEQELGLRLFYRTT